MLKPTTPSSPLPASLRIGAFVVDIPARELLADDGSKQRVTGKALQVLIELARRPGQVLTRDELMDRVWTDVFPTNDVLTQAIAVLRKALTDDADAPRYIETIAKSGYRLLALVQWQDAVTPLPMPSADERNAPSASLDQPAPETEARATVAAMPRPIAPSMQRWRSVLMVSSALLFAAVSWWQFSRRTPSQAEPIGLKMEKPTIIVSDVGDDWSPRISPDGAMLVYAATPTRGERDRLFVQATLATTPTALTAPGVDERDILPVWSPDGREIAFKRLQGNAGCAMLLVAASGGAPRRLGDCIGPASLRFDWMPDGRALVSGGFADPAQAASSLWRMNLDDGQWRPLFAASAAQDIDVEPHYSPDGRWLAFMRGISGSDLWRMPAEGGVAERLTFFAADMRGFDWTPDGRYLIFNAYRDSKLGLWSVDVLTKRTTVLDIGKGRRPDFALRSPQMVYEIPRMQTKIFRFDLRHPNPVATRILDSSATETGAVATPDGSAVAFYSDRSGVDRVWIAPIDGDLGVPQQVDDVLPPTLIVPTWSPDGQRLLVVGEFNDSTALYEVTRNSLRAERLAFDRGAPQFADYLANGDVLVGTVEGEFRRLIHCRREGNRLIAHTVLEGITHALVDRARKRIVFTRTFKAGLYSSALDGSDERPLLADFPALPDYRRWTLLDDRFFVLAHDVSLSDSRLLQGSLTDPAAGVTDLGKIGNYYPYLIGPLYPDQLLFAGSDGRGSDIALTRYAPVVQ